MRLQGKTALITGGLRGIGRATADRFAQEGAKVYITDIDTPEAAKALLEGHTHQYIQANVADEADWQIVTKVISAAGVLNCLINNAGVDCVGPVQDTSLADWRRIMSINVDGAFMAVKHCHDLLSKGGKKSKVESSVINVSSIMGKVGYIDTSGYNTSKGAIKLFTKATAIEFAAKKTPIRVNSIHPGFASTPLLNAGMERLEETGAGSKNDLMKMLGDMTPMGRVADPVEIANVILFLASDESAYMTGSEVMVDGGWTAQ
ncbi:SDR family NAD(P)-dependent oxidoreductase [Litorimonas sp.]|uniref:SDR family NAD(P)-dependent oxidoreductase n=1 Tax=Litorimonas sp. TaxID=1892381 RepID=UPI003A89C53A